MKKRLLAVLLVVAMALTCSAYDTKKPMTYAEWVATYYPTYTNDLTEYLPYVDMIGAPLAQLKQAVKESEFYSEDNSVFASLETKAGFKENVDPDFVFSTRKFNSQGESALENGLLKGFESWINGSSAKDAFYAGLDEADKTIGNNAKKGAGNLVSATMEEACYYYVYADKSKDRLITSVYMIYDSGTKESEDIKKVWKDMEAEYYGVTYSKNQKITYLHVDGVITQNMDYQKVYEAIKSGKKNTIQGLGYLRCCESLNDLGNIVVYISAV